MLIETFLNSIVNGSNLIFIDEKHIRLNPIGNKHLKSKRRRLF